MREPTHLTRDEHRVAAGRYLVHLGQGDVPDDEVPLVEDAVREHLERADL